MKKIILTAIVLFSAAGSLHAAGYDLGLRYGIGISSIGQDPPIETFSDKATFLNFMLSNELVINRIFRIELDLLFDERGYTTSRGDRLTYRIHFFELPLLAKIYPIKYLYIGAGFGYAYKYKVENYKDYSFSSLLHGVQNFIDEKSHDHEINFVLSLGFSYMVHEKITIIAEVRHTYGLTNSNRHSMATVMFPKEDFIERYRMLYFFVGASFRVL